MPYRPYRPYPKEPRDPRRTRYRRDPVEEAYQRGLAAGRRARYRY